MTEPSHCADVVDVLPELATGAATGQDRARALRHVAGCPSCRRELDSLSAVADELLMLAPEREPPAGFEAAVLARLDARPAAPRRGRAVRTLLAAAALAVVAATSAGTTLGYTADDRRLADSYRQTLRTADGYDFRAAQLTAAGRAVGQVFAYTGRPSWIFVNLNDPPTAASYTLSARTDDGHSHRLGTCEATQRRPCSVGGTVDSPAAHVVQIRLTAPGAPTLTAELP